MYQIDLGNIYKSVGGFLVPEESVFILRLVAPTYHEHILLALPFGLLNYANSLFSLMPIKCIILIL